MDDDALRGLADWTQDWGALKPIDAEITKVWAKLKALRVQRAEARARLVESCPLELTELEVRFWSKVHIVDDDDSCWPFTGGLRAVPGEEYGLFRLNSDDTIGAHRLAYSLANGGEVPDHARHTCDHPPCCRPKHLLDGTHADNMRDRQERGRYGRKPNQRGEANDSAVLTDAIVLDARQRSKAGETQKVIAASHDVSVAVLGYAIRGQTWTHLNEIESPYVRSGSGGTHLTEDIVRAIRRDRADGASYYSLGPKYDMTPSNVRSICLRKSWAHVE